MLDTYNLENVGLEENQVVLMNLHEKCKLIFEYEKQVILKHLQDLCITIEHVGSTSIKGVLAKPIVDIAVGVQDLNVLKSIPPILINAGYEHLHEHGSEDRLLFVKRVNNRCFLHIHVEIYQGESWQNHVLFKKYIQENSQALFEYNQIKEQLAAVYSNDRELYTTGKANFIQSCIQKAKHK